MAIKTIYVDDLDGSTDSVKTIQFAVDDVAYSIDLAPHNVDKLRDALAPFIAHGQRLTPGARQRRDKPEKSSPASQPTETPAESAPADPVAESGGGETAPAVAARPGREQLQAIRDWARKAGYGVSERGRISQQIRDAFEAAHQPR
jgi:hypothetical protein